MSEAAHPPALAALSEAAFAFGVLADHERFKIAAALALGASTLTEVADRTGLSPRDIERGVSRLIGAGLVDESRGTYRLRFEELQRIARAAADERKAAEQTPEGADQVVARFFRGGKLTSIPMTRSKRVAVLDYLAQEFEPGRLYSEKRVSETLSKYHDDYASLRRYLVDEGFLERKDARYWRSGGSFSID